MLMLRSIAVALCLMSGMASAEEKPPSGWIKAGSEPEDYEMGTTTVEGSRVGYIRPAVDDPKPFATLMQIIDTHDFRSQRVRLSARIKTIQAVRASMWMRVDGALKPSLRFDNMADRPLTGDTDWARYSIVLDIPAGAEKIAFGALSTGKGEVLFDDFTLEVVDLSVPTTNLESQPIKPKNLDFEH